MAGLAFPEEIVHVGDYTLWVSSAPSRLLQADVPRDELERVQNSLTRVKDLLQEVHRYGQSGLSPRRSERLSRILGQAPEPSKGPFDEALSTHGIVSDFVTFSDNPVKDLLVALDHQLSTDSDLKNVTAPEKYRALRQARAGSRAWFPPTRPPGAPRSTTPLWAP